MNFTDPTTEEDRGNIRTIADADAFRKNGNALIEMIANYMESVGEMPVTSASKPGEIRRSLPEHPPAAAESFSAVIDDIHNVVLPSLTHWQHPSFFAYFPSNISYPSILAELLSAGLGQQGMSWVTSPACTEMETLMLDWMQELLGLPEGFRSTSSSGGGVIQGTASEATLCSIIAARWRITKGAINNDGDTSKLIAYTSSQAHSSIEKGLRIAGIGKQNIRVISHDSNFAMISGELEKQILLDKREGFTPFWVCSSIGTTSSGACDPTRQIATIARAHGMWIHVDAAMQGMAALAPEFRWLNDGVELVDSYCTNPHKWMGVNFDCDLFWTTDRHSLISALSILPEYLRSAAALSGAVIDYRDWQIPLGRRFRSLKLWFAIRLEGVTVFQEMIRSHVRWTQDLAAKIRTDDRFEILAPHPLNLICLRLKGESPLDGDARTDALIEAANATREVLFTRTVLDGRSVLRFSIGVRTTEYSHVLAGWELCQRLAK